MCRTSDHCSSQLFDPTSEPYNNTRTRFPLHRFLRSVLLRLASRALLFCLFSRLVPRALVRCVTVGTFSCHFCLLPASQLNCNHWVEQSQICIRQCKGQFRSQLESNHRSKRQMLPRTMQLIFALCKVMCSMQFVSRSSSLAVSNVLRIDC